MTAAKGEGGGGEENKIPQTLLNIKQKTKTKTKTKTTTQRSQLCKCPLGLQSMSVTFITLS